MKTLIKTIAFTCLSLSLANSSFAADSKDKTDKAAEKAAERAAETNHIVMKGGKLIVMKDGESMPLKEEVTLMDGTKVMPDGSYLTKTGHKKLLKEGDAITWKGKVTDHDKLMKEIEKDQEKAAKDAAKDKEKAEKEAAKEKK